MPTWHEKDCRRPDVVLMDNTPTCLSCGSIFLSNDEAQGQLSKQTAAVDEDTPCLNLDWPSSITFSSREDVTDPDLRRTLLELDRRVGVVDQDMAPETNNSEIEALIDEYSTTETEVEQGIAEGKPQNVTEAHTGGASPDNYDHSAAPKSGLDVTPGKVELDTMRQAETYHALTGTDEIRLLHLDPYETPSEPLHGCLTPTRLSQRPYYIALSYTWANTNGDRTLSDNIFLGKAWTPFAITSNCAAALRRLRLRGGPRVLWVDSICIDQTNIGERSHQVSMMRDIYSRAESVAIFLGGDTSTNINTPAGRLMQRLSDDRLHAGRAVKNNWGGEFDYWGVCDLFQQPYWSRIWVIQEVLLARQAEIILGDAEVPLHEFIENFMKLLPDTVGFWLPLWIYSLGGSHYGEVDAFYDLLNRTSTCTASDERDLVFALFGLVPGANFEGLVADYSKTMEEIYTGLATYFLIRHGQSRLLKAAAGATTSAPRIGPGSSGTQFSRSPRLPSWVPFATFSSSHNTGFKKLQENLTSTELLQLHSHVDRESVKDDEHCMTEVPPRSCKSPPTSLNTCKVFGNHGTLLIRASPVVYIPHDDPAPSHGAFTSTTKELDYSIICILKATGTLRSWEICVHTGFLRGHDNWIVEVPGCDTFLHLMEDGRVAGTYQIASMSSVCLASSYHTRHDISNVLKMIAQGESIAQQGEMYENEFDYRLWMPLVAFESTHLLFLRQLGSFTQIEKSLDPFQAGSEGSSAELSPELLEKYDRWLELHCPPLFQDGVYCDDFDSVVKTVSLYLESWEDRHAWFCELEVVFQTPWQEKLQELGDIRAEAWQYLVARNQSESGDGNAYGAFHWEQRLHKLFDDLLGSFPDIPLQTIKGGLYSGNFMSTDTCLFLCKCINDVPESWTVEELQAHEAKIFEGWGGVESCWEFMNRSQADYRALMNKFAQLRALKRLCRREQRDFLIC